jgi:hypothetical protein
MIRSYTIDDDLAGADHGAIEVTVTLTDERRRWCFFMTPQALAACGDRVSGTRVVGEISREIIETVLRELDVSGELEHRTLPLAAG